MLCDACGERPATVHYKRIVNGKTTELHLCEECAREQGDFGFTFEVEPKFSINQLLAGLLSGSLPQGGTTRAARSVARCDACGLSYQEFAKSGKLGCDHCYEKFGPQLQPLFRRLHGHAAHTGKVPGRLGSRAAVRRDVGELRQELEQAVAEERYERAAELRDQILELEQKGRQET